MQKCHIAMSPASTRSKLEVIGENHDRAVTQWKDDRQSADQSLSHLTKLQDIISHPTVCDADWSNESSISQNKTSKSNMVENAPCEHDNESPTKLSDQFSTLDLSELEGNLECSERVKYKEPLIKSLLRSEMITTYSENIADSVLEQVKEEIKCGQSEELSISNTFDSLRERKVKEKQIVGDNLDFDKRRKHLSSEKRNESLHYFQSYAIDIEATGSHLANDRNRNCLLQLPPSKFVPDLNDALACKKDFIILWSQVITRCMPAFECLSKSVIWHIPHAYTEKFKEESTVTPLGIIPENEATYDGMIKILQTIHQEYIPSIYGADGRKDVNDDFWFIGDWLTVARAEGAIELLADGCTGWDKLKGLIPANADWHAIRTAYKAATQLLRDPCTEGIQGTLWANATLINNHHGKEDVEKKYSEFKEFFGVNLDAFVIAATMNHFGMKSPDDRDAVPFQIQGASPIAQRSWLTNKIEAMVDKYIFSDLVSSGEQLGESLNFMATPRFSCPHCGKSYVYFAAFEKHVKRIHKLELQGVNVESQEDDQKYNYACNTLTLGLLLRDIDDAVTHGDGERIIRVWKYFTLLFKKTGHHNYALAALKLQAQLEAILSEKKAHQLIWNRTMNPRPGIGHRKSLDLKCENLQLVAKTMLRHSGMVNLTADLAIKTGKSVGGLDQLVNNFNKDLKLKKPSGHHAKPKHITDCKKIARSIHLAEMFNNVQGRKLHGLEKGAAKSILSVVPKDFYRWMKEWCQKWHNHYKC